MALKLSFRELLDSLEYMTDRNGTTEAFVAIAEYFGMTKFVKIFDWIFKLHMTDAYMHPDLSKYRQYQYEQMMHFIIQKHGKEVAQEIEDCL
jgi:hypothetical protein